jgi:CRP-like cAMP-binding protein
MRGWWQKRRQPDEPVPPVAVTVGSWHADVHADEILDVTTRVRMRAGRRVVRGGAAGREVFILVDGVASIHHPATGAYLGTLRTGEVFGELSVLSGDPRRADVVANTDIEVLVMTPAEFDVLQQRVHDMPAALQQRLASLS